MASGAEPAPVRVRSPRPRRADARRNYERLLSAARDLFDERGAGAPLDEIARRAGVGNATMYRHFPTRRDLIIAVYADEVEELCEEGTSLLTAESPWDALFVWLESFVTHISSKRELLLAIPEDQGSERSRLFERWHQAMYATASALLDRARRAGAVDEGLDVADLITTAHGIALATGGADQTRRLLAYFRHGISAS